MKKGGFVKKIVLAVAVTLAFGIPMVQADDHIEAKKICQDFVHKRLKAPSAARFESLNNVAAQPSKDKKWKKMKNVWDSVGWVDSQNSFGAMIRSEYMCTVQKLPNNGWKLLDLYWFKQPLQ